MSIETIISLITLAILVGTIMISHERRDAKRQRDADKHFGRIRTALLIVCRELNINGDVTKSLEDD